MKVAKTLNAVEVYEQLTRFNQQCASALELVEAFGRRRMIPSTEHRYYRALLRELRAAISQTVIEHVDQQEMALAAKASRERLKLEKQMLK